MYLIYSLEINSLAIKVYDFCKTSNSVSELLDVVARNFIRQKEGDIRSESPYRDNVENESISEEGYFLRHSSDQINQIDVYYRKIVPLPGRIWNSYTVECKKVMFFATTKASLGLPIECTGQSVTHKKFTNELEQQHQNEHIKELKERLISQKEKVDKCLENISTYEYNLPNYDSDDESDDEKYELHKRPEIILKERVESISQYTMVPTPPPLP